MEEVWSVMKDTSIPILFRPVKYKDMNKEKKFEALRDTTIRIIFLVLLPLFVSMVLSFTVSIMIGMLINEMIIRILGSDELHKKLRQGSVLIGGSASFGLALIVLSLYIITPIYHFLGAV